MRGGRSLGHVLLSTLLVTSIVTFAAPARAGLDQYRPDAWLKLCGWGDTCRHAPPHRYFGNDIYNASGSRQTVSSGLEEGNDIRF